MLKSLVSPMFLAELKQGNVKKKQRAPLPIPDGFSFLRRGGSSLYVYHGKSLIGKVASIDEVHDMIKFYKENQEVIGKKVFTIKRLSTFRWHVLLNGVYQVTKSSEKAAQRYIERFQ